MRYVVQLLANNLLQEIPSVLIAYQHSTENAKYLFNTPEQQCRYAPCNSILFSSGMSVFFTRLNADSMAGLVRMCL